MSARPIRVKIYGERNTGTRAAIRMLEAAEGLEEHNFPEIPVEELEGYEARIAELESRLKGPWRRVYREAVRDLRADRFGPTGAWKHGAAIYDPAFARAGLHVLFLVRNPYSWLLALHGRPYHALGRRGGAFSEFLARPWLSVRRDHVPPILENPMELWNAKLRSYVSFIEAAQDDGVPAALMRFEDFVHAPAQAMKLAFAQMGVSAKSLRPTKPTKPMGKRARERRDYYGRELWREALSAPDVAVINKAIDWDLAARFGYKRIAASAFAGRMDQTSHVA